MPVTKHISSVLLIVALLTTLAVSTATAQDQPNPNTEHWLFEAALRNSQIELAYSTLSSFWGVSNPAFDGTASEEDKALILIMLNDTSHISVFLDITQEGCDYFHSTPEAVVDAGILGGTIARAQRTYHQLRNDLLEESIRRLSPATRNKIDQLILDIAESLREGTRVTNNQDMEQQARLDPEDFLEKYPSRCERVSSMRERLEAGEWQVYGESAFLIK